MGNYRNFELVAYFVAQETCQMTPEYVPTLQKEIDFFKKYCGLDKIYLEAHRDASFATEEQVRLAKKVFEDNGIKVEGGITTCSPDLVGAPKQRIFNVLCYNDEAMLKRLEEASALNGCVFDSFIIDDFYFTNCTCPACRAEHDAYNKEHGITDGSWQDYRVAKMYEISKKYMIAPAKKENPNCNVIIKFPNWMESYQETGYDPASQKDIFDGIYTGTETRDPFHHDQHLPRYLSYSLMRYMEAMSPGRNGGGWFDPYDCHVLDYYLEQAYLTCFAKPKEVMLFCFQSLLDTMNLPALGFQLEKLDDLLDHLGEPIGIPCYIPNASQGEDNVQDYLGMQGFPIVTTPNFEADAPTMFLTASSAYDEDIVEKLKAYVAKGGKAIVTNGFVTELLDEGLADLTSIRCRGRIVTVNDFVHERADGRYGIVSTHGADPITMPIMEFRNNSTWGAPCKGLRGDETYTMLSRDTYGDGEMNMMVVPDAFSDIQKLPTDVLSRLRAEFAVNGIRMEGPAGTSIFLYDNDTFVLYTYVLTRANDADVFLHIKGATGLARLEKGAVETDPVTGLPKQISVKPLYTIGDEAVFRLDAKVGIFSGWKILR